MSRRDHPDTGPSDRVVPGASTIVIVATRGSTRDRQGPPSGKSAVQPHRPQPCLTSMRRPSSVPAIHHCETQYFHSNGIHCEIWLCSSHTQWDLVVFFYIQHHTHQGVFSHTPPWAMRSSVLSAICIHLLQLMFPAWYTTTMRPSIQKSAYTMRNETWCSSLQSFTVLKPGVSAIIVHCETQ